MILSLTAGLLMLALLALGALALLYFSDFTLPGVQALGLELGGKTTVQAADALLAGWQSQTIAVTAGSRTWQVPPNQLGLVLDADATVRQAHAQGRSPEGLAQLWQTRGRVSVAPVWNFDPLVAETFLRTLAAEVGTPAQDAGLRVVDGRVEEIPGVPGWALDVQANVDWLHRHASQVLQDRRLDVNLVVVSPAINDLAPAISQANQLLGATYPVYLYDPLKDEKFTWQITPQVIGGWLTLHLNPEDPAYLKWTVEQAKVQTFLRDRQQETLGATRFVKMDEALPAVVKMVTEGGAEVRLRVYHGEQQYAVQPDENISSIGVKFGMPYPWIQKANPGLGDMLQVGQKITIPSPDVLVPLPPVENKRIIVSIKDQNVKVLENGAVKWNWKASTGMDSSPTSPGIFQVRSHELTAYAANWNLWMPYFLGIYQPVPGNDFMNGFHGFPSRQGSQILWTNNLGAPITYGCILVSTDNEIALYKWAEDGVVVEIRP
jgi:lipoprotein-anchoring transpeptidase ErfK/SrfK